MANTIVEFFAPSGLTLTLKLFPKDSDTIANGASGDSATEATNRKGLYTATVTQALTNRHSAHIFSGSDLISVGFTDLSDDTNTYRVIDWVDTVTGTGANSVTITVDDGTNPLENASVKMTSGSESYTGTTNVSGQIVFSLDTATWNVAISKAVYSFTPTTLAVSTTTTQTYSMSAIVVPASSADQVTGYLYMYDSVGVIESGARLEYKITKVGSALGFGYDDTLKTVTSDTNGKVELPNLFKGATYNIRRGDSKRWYAIAIPSGATDPYEMTSVIGSP